MDSFKILTQTDKELLNFLDYLKSLSTFLVTEANTFKTQVNTLENISDTDAIPF